MVGKRRGRHPRNDLDAKKVAALIRKGKAGRHFDGAGLHLLIKPTGAASWVLRLSVNGKRRDYGLGGADSVALADAREATRKLRAIAKAGGDPLDEKRKSRAIPTFEDIARSVHAGHSGAWRNKKHSVQWLSTLQAYVFPEIGATRVDLIDVADILKVLTPIWLTKPETARRLRQRLRVVFDVARASGYRSGENPVDAVLAKALPKQTAKPSHHSAMPYVEVPAFFAHLGAANAGGEVARLALRLLILTATRTGEIVGARRSEIDLDARVWTIPAERMKAMRQHKVPLSDAAVSIVKRAIELSADADLIFPSTRTGKRLGSMSLLSLMYRAGLEAVPHGFRSSFRDWAAETTGFPSEVAEMALAHMVGTKTERAYSRSDLFEKRRKLMEAWASFVTTAGSKVISMRRKVKS